MISIAEKVILLSDLDNLISYHHVEEVFELNIHHHEILSETNTSPKVMRGWVFEDISAIYLFMEKDRVSYHVLSWNHLQDCLVRYRSALPDVGIWDIYPFLYGEDLRDARTMRGESQREAAEILGSSQSVVARWEVGDRQPNIGFREKLCKVYGV